MSISQGPKIYAGMLKRELLEIADRLGIRGVSKLKKEELIEVIQVSLRRSRRSEAASASKPAPSPPKAPEKRQDQKPGATKAAPTRPPASKAAAASPVSHAVPAAPPKAKQARADSAAPAPSQSPRPEAGTPLSEQSRVMAAKYRVGTPYAEEDLRGVDEHLPGLPDGYGIDRLVLLPRDPAWLYVYWDLRNETKEGARQRGGQSLALRLYEEAESGLEPMAEHWCQELARSWYLQVPAPGRSYVAEIGYRAANGSWLGLLRSNSVQVPPAGPSPMVADEFLTIDPSAELPGRRRRGGRAAKAAPPRASAAALREASAPSAGVHQASYDAAVGLRGTLPAGSVGFGAGAAQGISSAALPTSPAGFPGSPAGGPLWGAAPSESGSFWLVADAELIVFGATEPDAELTVGDRPVRLRPDGTFSLRMTFPDGVIDVPIVARSADGKHERRMALHFERSTRRGEDGEQQSGSGAS